MTKNHFVLLIDLLGFSDFVNKNSSDKVYELLNTFLEMPKLFNLPYYSYNMNVFSDTIVISTPIDENIEFYKLNTKFIEFINYVNFIQMTNIVNESLPMRGAITYGEFFTNGKDLIFGKALIEAYQTEMQKACYPRIIINPNILDPDKAESSHEIIKQVFIKLNMTDFEFINSKFNKREYYIRKDFDGLLHCNYLYALRKSGGEWIDSTHEVLTKHREYIIKNINKAINDSVLKKYDWMKSYHNWFCETNDEFLKYII